MAKRGRKKKSITRIIPRLKLKTSTVQSIFFVFFFILAIISVFSFLQIGPVPSNYNRILNNYFGFTSVLLPFLFILIALLFAKIKSQLKEPNIFLGFLIMFISILCLFQQGLIGNFLWQQILSLFTQVPTFLIFFFSFIVGFVVLFDTSVAQIVKFGLSVVAIVKKYSIGNARKRKKKKEAFINKPNYLSHPLLHLPALLVNLLSPQLPFRRRRPPLLPPIKFGNILLSPFLTILLVLKLTGETFAKMLK